ncbi:PP2C family protein-serine/threonine phosphatase [Sphaerisporangium rufum]|uniref:PP2C family protein-serine/threonine phosphatase n=1 Tax=Sphaerisporangium rufum TaxID=1381558 RepID=UPI0019508C40|nr:PP2C family protein-serine/threonine phosphatase [Sphaerisporangium rufum]
MGGAPPPLPTPNDPGTVTPRGVPRAAAEAVPRLRVRLAHAHRTAADLRRRLMQAQRRWVEERHVSLALRDAILPDPGTSIRLPGVHIAVRYVPAGQGSSLGGDWYEASPLPGGRVLVAVGDAAGHGSPAVARMARLRHALVGLGMTGQPPDRLLGWLNELVCQSGEDATATAVVGHLRPESGEFVWAQAGHLPPILVRGGAARALAPPPGVLLGGGSGQRYGRRRLALRPGDVLLLYTDGLVERRGADIGEGLAAAVAAAGALRCADGLEEQVARLVEAATGPDAEDDTCLLAVGVLER